MASAWNKIRFLLNRMAVRMIDHLRSCLRGHAKQEIFRQDTIKQKLDVLNSQCDRARNRSKEWRESIESADVAHRPSRLFAHRNESSPREMSYMLCFIHRGNQTRP